MKILKDMENASHVQLQAYLTVQMTIMMSPTHAAMDITWPPMNVSNVIYLVELVMALVQLHVLPVGTTPLLVVDLMVAEQGLILSFQTVPVYVTTVIEW